MAPVMRSPGALPRGLRLAFVLLLVAGVLVAGAPARACSCAEMDLGSRLPEADGAFVGTYVDRDPLSDGRAAWTFVVERVVKGPFGPTAIVRTSGDGASCGIELFDVLAPDCSSIERTMASGSRACVSRCRRTSSWPSRRTAIRRTRRSPRSEPGGASSRRWPGGCPGRGGPGAARARVVRAAASRRNHRWERRGVAFPRGHRRAGGRPLRDRAHGARDRAAPDVP